MATREVGTAAAVGAVVGPGEVQFRIWAPTAGTVEVLLESGSARGAHALETAGNGWFTGRVAGARAGDRYRLRVDGGDPVPDPLSRSQPDDVHGPSQILDLGGFEWTDGDWAGRPLEDLVIYEVHVGTATPAGTFDGLVDRLDDIAALGVTAIEVMPVAEFPGRRNWGYDGTYLFAPTHAYGGADGLRRLVDAAHARGLAVILDVVYNHFGPEGNYMPAVTGGRIFTERHHTPWGAAVNYDDTDSAGVREIVLANVAEWVRDYHVDGLRLDAAHAIFDATDPHILAEIARTARAAADRPITIIAEDERNERTVLLPEGDGLGLDAVWADDWHHCMRRLLAGDSEGYYGAYEGTVRELVKTMQHGWLYAGEVYAPLGKPRGTPADGIPAPRFVHCLQNHDQVGNRALGERLHHQIDLAAYRAASALLLLSPYTPMLWMGQEWAATAPFLYFTDHPTELGRLVTEGRREEFKGFSEFADASKRERIPDPQESGTFERSKIDWAEREQQPHAGMLRLYRELLTLRGELALKDRDRSAWSVAALSDGAVALQRRGGGAGAVLVVANLRGSLHVDLSGPGTGPTPRSGAWQFALWTEDQRFAGDAAVPPPALEGEQLRMGGPGAVVLRS